MFIQGDSYYQEFDADVSLAAYAPASATLGLRCSLRDTSYKELGIEPVMAFIDPDGSDGTYSMSIGSTKLEDLKQLEGWYSIKAFNTSSTIDDDPTEFTIQYGKWKAKRLITE